MQYIQTVIVFLIVAGAAVYLIRRFYNNLKKRNSPSCGCGCTGCNDSHACEEIQQRPL